MGGRTLNFEKINKILTKHGQNDLIQSFGYDLRPYSEGVLGQISILMPDEREEIIDYAIKTFQIQNWERKKPLVLWDSLITAKIEPMDEFRNEDIGYYFNVEDKWDTLKEELKRNGIEYFPKGTIAQYLSK